MTTVQPRSGYTLPVFACASAIAALRYLQEGICLEAVSVDLRQPATLASIPVEQVARLQEHTALAITCSDPGDNLDLTRHTPVWAMVELRLLNDGNSEESIILVGGEGIGRRGPGGDAAIYNYAQRLFHDNLTPLLPAGSQIIVTLILPSGRELARRTSNEAFGIVEGLSLLGTSGLSQPLSSPDQLATFRAELQAKTDYFDALVFCIGENGLALATQLGIHPQRLVKTANWLGPMLVEAGLQGVQSLLLFGYHGKLMKLAAGIFHTHHFLADGRREILTAYSAKAGVPSPLCAEIFASPTAEDALKLLQSTDSTGWTQQVYSAIAREIDQRAGDYIFTHSQHRVTVGSILFGRDRKIIVKSEIADTLFPQVC